MTTKLKIIICAIALTGTMGVDQAVSNDLEKVLNSEKKWEKTKQECDGDYSYLVRWTSFAGFGTETTILVKNNRVTGREFKTLKLTDGPTPPDQKQEKWAETLENLGSHTRGALPKTLDELYREARQVAGRKLSENERRFLKFDENGLLLQCYIVDARIADDAPQEGVDLNRISLGRVGQSSSETVGLKLTNADNGKSLQVTVGQKIQIRLDSNPTTGFRWNNTTRSKKLKLAGEISYQPGGTALGSGGVSTATFKAVQVGKGKIVLEYKRDFEDKPAAKTFSVKINVVESAEDTQSQPTYRAPNGKAFPVHWGAPPKIQTRDRRPLPGGYGQGSGTLARWIQENLDRDAAGKNGK
ncbi:MAG: protease inhibitor I42 family protein [Planctomycetota bacterium]|nr:protease inhibitor I42 family protein [Planctomycetota bacterium]